uniref:Histone deacetylase HDT1 n=1 Tax=Tanacetum cinerariifolium TaxID=118510 RepID=A0A6L2N6W1_TANCI|nr:histone deacetylase HDT1 [Tanacetum cinerariifolium]
MEFWGVEVKSGETFEVALGDEKVLHLSQACLGETKNNKSESVCLHINVEGKKLVLGTLHSERLPQQLFDLVFDKTFTISHNWKNGSVYFYGYQADQPSEESDDDSEEDSEEEEEAIRLPIPNGKPEAKKEVKEAKKEVKETKKEEKPVAANKKDAKQVTIVEPGKDDSDDSDDSDSDDSDDSDSMSTDSGSDEEGVGKDSDDSDDSSDEEEEKEETPKKPQSGKKRQNESAMKTPTTDKKAKMSTPQKTDGKKAAVHVATPHPSKKPDAKSAGSKSNQKSPASDGAHCKSCNRNFKTDGGLQAHNQAKHASYPGKASLLTQMYAASSGSLFNLFMYVRPTKPLHWWECGKILGGRDVTAGGTWLASNRQGRVAFVTNVRELNSLSAVAAKSRGDLPVQFLQSDKTPLEFAEETVKETDQYNGFNLLIADILSMNMVYVTNRPKGGSDYVTSVPPGAHVLSNASLNTPWPKVSSNQRLEHGFRDFFNQYGDGEIPINEMVDKLMGNTVKDELSKLPHIYSAEMEY